MQRRWTAWQIRHRRQNNRSIRGGHHTAPERITMDRQRASEIVRSRLDDYLIKKGLPLNKKFRCLSPTHPDKHPSMEYDKKRNNVHCFSCHVSYSIFDLIGMDYGLTETADIFNKAYELYGITIDDSREKRPTEPRNDPQRVKVSPEQEKPTESPTDAAESKPDFTEYYKSCKEHINDPAAQAYLSFRGISKETAARYWLGYDPAKHLLIIPAARSFYAARDTTGRAKNRYDNPAGVSVSLFNKAALQNADGRPVFITEGAINALSIIEAGGEALALNGAGNWRKVIEELKTRRTRSTLILCLDNDDAGEKAAAQLADGLRELNISFVNGNVNGDHNDPNEALTSDRAAFIEAVQTTAKEIQYPGLLTTARAIATLEAVDEHYLEMPHFKTFCDMVKLKTHDSVVIAADTGAGKSSLALNFLHDLQEHYPALYINLEMDEATILQRLVAIHTGIELDRIEGYKHDANTRAEVNAAIAEITARKEIQLLEDIYDLKEIEKQIQAATAGRKEPTMVFVDTGLLVTLPNKNASRYERFTQISEELRRISRLNNVVMFVLLQQNREGKKEDQKQPTNSSLKESGSWENDATKIMFLWENPQTHGKELVITKNRSGRTGNIKLNYEPHTQKYSEERKLSLYNAPTRKR